MSCTRARESGLPYILTVRRLGEESENPLAELDTPGCVTEPGAGRGAVDGELDLAPEVEDELLGVPCGIGGGDVGAR